MNERQLRAKILDSVRQYASLYHAPEHFEPGKSRIPVSGRVYGEEEMLTLTEATLEFWLTAGRYDRAFCRKLGEFLGIEHVITVNSGSSANLLAIAALCSASLGDRHLKPGDEVISVAAGFPTTVNPLILYGLKPVFVDVDIPTYNIDVDRLEAALSDKTRAVFLAHTLGNPFNVAVVKQLAERYGLWLVEDCCDALGSEYQGRYVATFGDLATLSFYPAHHITMGEGGAVLTNDDELARLVVSLRDWGRDCYCAPGKDNTCGRRFEYRSEEMPSGYDHKYVYSELGFNLKITDMQAAVGVAQLGRLPEFISARKRNYRFLSKRLTSLEEFLVLPQATRGSDPSWFGFPLTLRSDSPVERVDLLRHLNRHRIGTRLMFGGNLTRQPYFRNREYRIAGDLSNTDTIMKQTFWVGVYPGLDERMLEYVGATLEDFFRGRGR